MWRTNIGGAQFGLTPQESAQALVQLAGTVGPAVPLLPTFRALAGSGAGFGIDVNSLVQGYGSLVQAGVASGPTSQGVSARAFADMLAAAVASGSMNGRQGEVLSALTDATNALSQKLVGLPGVGTILGAQAALNATGVQGLMGQSGASVLNALSAGMASPGAGPGGQLLNLRMFAQPGMSYPQVLFSEQAGAYFSPPGGRTNLLQFLQGMHGMFPGVGARSFDAAKSYYPLTAGAGIYELLASQVFGLGMSQAGALGSVRPAALERTMALMQHMYGSLKGTPTSALSIAANLLQAQSASPAQARKYLESAAAQLRSTAGNPSVFHGQTLGSLLADVRRGTVSASAASAALLGWLKQNPNTFLTQSQKAQANLQELESVWLQVGKDLLAVMNPIAAAVKGTVHGVGWWLQNTPAFQELGRDVSSAVKGGSAAYKWLTTMQPTGKGMKALEDWAHAESNNTFGFLNPTSSWQVQNPLGVRGVGKTNGWGWTEYKNITSGYRGALQQLQIGAKAGNVNYADALKAIELAQEGKLTPAQAGAASAYFAALGGWAGAANKAPAAAMRYAENTNPGLSEAALKRVFKDVLQVHVHTQVHAARAGHGHVGDGTGHVVSVSHVRAANLSRRRVRG